MDQNESLIELGRLAAERREEANLSLQDIYERTKIRIEYLRGIESGNYNGFPEPVYVRGFVRTYLSLINAQDLQDDFIAQLARLNSQPHNKHQHEMQITNPNILGSANVQKGFKPVSHMWLFIVLLAALAGTGVYVWYSLSNGGFSLENFKWPNFAATSASDENNNSEPEVQPEPVPVVISEDKKPEPEPKPQPVKIKPYIEIRAQNDVWLSVSIGDNNVFRKTLRKGGAVSWDMGSNNARVTYGRPNAAIVILNGKNLGPASPRPTKKSETYIYFPDGTSKKNN